MKLIALDRDHASPEGWVSVPRDPTSSALEELQGRVPVRMALVAGMGARTPVLVGELREAGIRALGCHESTQVQPLIDERQPDLILVGEELADLDAFSLLAQLNGQAEFVFFLMADLNSSAIDDALFYGAHDVMLPPHNTARILFRTRIMGSAGPRRTGVQSRGRGSQGRSAGPGGWLEIGAVTGQVLNGPGSGFLTARELGLLLRLHRAAGGVVTRQELLDDVWGQDHPSTVVETTVSRLRRKMGEPAGDPRLLTTVRGIGYRLEPTRITVRESA